MEPRKHGSMRILFTIHHTLSAHAGAAGATMALANAYAAVGHDVSVFSFNDLPRWMSPVAKAAAFPWYVARHVEQVTRRRPLDVLDSSTGDAFLCGPLKRRVRLLVTRSHGLEHTQDRLLRESAATGELRLSRKYPIFHGGYQLKAAAASLRVADLVFLLNAPDRDYATMRLGVEPARIYLVSNGLPPSLLNLSLRPCPAEGQIGIAQVGSYIESKGIRHSVPALSAIMQRHRHVVVGFFGTGRDADVVLSDFEPSLHDRVTVVPSYRRDELPQLLRDYQISVLASLSEGFGMALLETMACGLAPVAARTAGPQRLLEDGGVGLLIPPRSAQAIEDAIELLLTDRTHRECLRTASQATAQRYGWTDIAAAQIKIYERHRR